MRPGLPLMQRIVVPGNTERTWFSGELLEGYVEVTARRGISFRLRIAFEGNCRVWIIKGHPDAEDPVEHVREHRFLNEDVQGLDTNATHISVDDRQIQRFPFRFVLPRHLPVTTTATATPVPFLQLPPSMEAGREFINAKNGKRYMQPLIVYEICSSITYDGGVPIDDRHAINLVPRLICGPPIEVEDFPGEFQTISVQHLRQGRALLRRRYGQMSISVEEPGPLCLDYPVPTTTCVIWIEYTPGNRSARNNSNIIHLLRQPWGCIIRTRLHVKMYYSTSKLNEMPRKPLQNATVGHSSDLRLRSEIIELESHKLQLQLRYCTAAVATACKPTAATSSPAWATSISFPVSIPADINILPAFVTGLAARSYALIFTVKLAGLTHKPFELEVPLQVVYETPAS